MNFSARLFICLPLLAGTLFLAGCGSRGSLTLPPKATAPAQTKAAPPKVESPKAAADDSSAAAPTAPTAPQ